MSTQIDRKRTAKASIPKVELEGIGKDGNQTIQQSIREVMTPLLEHAITEGLRNGVTKQIENKVKDVFSN